MQIDITNKLEQVILQNLVIRIKTCFVNNVLFNQDTTDLMNRLISSDTMVHENLQAIEANINIVTDCDGKLLVPMTTPTTLDEPEYDKVNCSDFIFNSTFPFRMHSVVLSCEKAHTIFFLEQKNLQYRSDLDNSNMVNSHFCLIQTFFIIFATFLSI